jgi:nucleotide-binding universal stress UspA family protein
MSGIVCAIRGGPASQPTIRRAIALAKETDLPLQFLYVVNLDFLTYTESGRVRNINSELEKMGDFILLAARDQAEREGVQAEGSIRHGTVREEIIQLAKDTEAAYVVLGPPRGELEEDVFTQERLHQFMERIEQESGARVVLAEVDKE